MEPSRTTPTAHAPASRRTARVRTSLAAVLAGTAAFVAPAMATSATTVYDLAPTAVIAGPNTLINSPAYIHVDGRGTVYVANYLGQRVSSWAAGRTGDVAPTTSLFGPATLIQQPQGVAVDSRGRLYVSQVNGDVSSFPASATGDIAPTTVLTGLSNSQALAFDSKGNLYVSEYGTGSVKVYGADRSGYASPIRTITGFSGPHGIAIDKSDRLYVADTGNRAIDVFAAGATGAASPVRRIAGPNTGLDATGPGTIALDKNGNVYEVDYEGPNEVNVYAANASGDAAPVAVIAGPSTLLTWPGGIQVDGRGMVYVANTGTTPYSPNSGFQGITIYKSPVLRRPAR